MTECFPSRPVVIYNRAVKLSLRTPIPRLTAQLLVKGLFFALPPGLVAQTPSVPAPASHPDWFREATRLRHAATAGDARVVFLGDSLTAFWPKHGIGTWQLDIVPLQPLNAGIPGDRVENVHFRAGQMNFGENPPDLVVIWCGTNNLGKEPPDDPIAVADGVISLTRTLRRKWPAARLLVLSIIPSGPDPDSALRRSIRVANERLQKAASAPDADFRWLDLHDHFIQPDGRWLPGLTLDGTHLTARGYDVLAKPLVEQITRLLR